MSDAWNVEELIARFELHPGFKEIYVEGETDIGFYSWFLEESGRNDVIVYPISAISIPDECSEQLGLAHLDKGSRRSKVIMLAALLQEKVPGAASNVSCVADADTQHICPETFNSNFLIFTDYTSIEMYGFRSDFITKIIRMGSPTSNLKGEDVLGQITGILEKLFSFRLASYKLVWGLKWISPMKECEYARGIVTFDEDAFVNKYLNTAGKRGKSAEFRRVMNALQRLFGENHRMQIRGHDFTALLAWYLKKCSHHAFHWASEESVRLSLLSQLRIEDLSSEPLFKLLLARYP